MEGVRKRKREAADDLLLQSPKEKLSTVGKETSAISTLNSRNRSGKMRWKGFMLNTEHLDPSANGKTPLLALPAEIRIQIWSLVLGGNTLHVRLDIQPRATRCKIDVCKAAISDSEIAAATRAGHDMSSYPKHCKRHQYCNLKNSIGKVLSGKRDPKDMYFVALLQTCRQVHSEAALLPFELNTIDFTTLYTIPGLLKQLMEIQRKSLRSISLSSGFLNSISRTEMSQIGSVTNVTVFHEDDSGFGIHGLGFELGYRARRIKFPDLKKVTCCITRWDDEYDGDSSKYNVAQQQLRAEENTSLRRSLEATFLSKAF